MVSMYDRVQDKDISYAVAMTEVKRRFINGNYGEVYKAPYYWAPFVYYGKDYEKTEEQRESVAARYKEPERQLIKKENQKLNEENEMRVKWSDWQDNMRTAVDEVVKYENNDNVSAGEMVLAWQYIIDNTNDNNPYSTEDEELRNRAKERLKYWKEYKEPKPAIETLPKTIYKTPTFDTTASVSLRSSYKRLSESQVLSISNVSIRSKYEGGFYCHSTIKHKYEKRLINGDSVVIDHATGLMWHQSGSDSSMEWKQAKKWVKGLNEKGYAGYYDWRLPTAEEAVSLLESSTHNNLHINTVFSNNQKWVWTGDKKGYSGKTIWLVDFYRGYLYLDSNTKESGVRPVRSVE